MTNVKVVEVVICSDILFSFSQESHNNIMFSVVYYFLLCAVLPTVVSVSVPFQTIEKGQYSAIEYALTAVYHTRKDFEVFWGRHNSNSYPRTNAPDVDFSSQMVAVVFIGTKRSGGYNVEVISVDEDEEIDELVVNVIMREPSPDDMVTMALTQPYHIISLEASEKNVAFVGITVSAQDISVASTEGLLSKGAVFNTSPIVGCLAIFSCLLLALS